MHRVGEITSGDASFTNCNFISCNNNKNNPQGNGGAVSYDVANGKLTVTSCYFYKCIAYQKEGGGIDARNVNDVTITSSAFVNCHADSIGNHASGGGGINLRSIQRQPFIQFCSFISCTSNDDGGGVAIWYSSAENPFFCMNCRFISCLVPNDATNDLFPCAGALIPFDNSLFMKSSNLVFAYNEGESGGAYVTNKFPDAPDYLLSFCFFNRNKGKYGNDICLSTVTEPVCFHCFSTSDETRIYKGNDHWLPQDQLLFFVNVCRIFS